MSKRSFRNLVSQRQGKKEEVYVEEIKVRGGGTIWFLGHRAGGMVIRPAHVAEGEPYFATKQDIDKFVKGHQDELKVKGPGYDR
jgi:hypothetical protein